MQQKRIIEIEKKLTQKFKLGGKGTLRSELAQAKANQRILKQKYRTDNVIGRNVLGKFNEIEGLKLKEQVEKTLDIEIDVTEMGVLEKIMKRLDDAIDRGNEEEITSIRDEMNEYYKNVEKTQEASSVNSGGVSDVGSGVGGIDMKKFGGFKSAKEYDEIMGEGAYQEKLK